MSFYYICEKAVGKCKNLNIVFLNFLKNLQVQLTSFSAQSKLTTHRLLFPLKSVQIEFLFQKVTQCSETYKK